MKISALVLLASLAVNVLLLGVLFAGRGATPAGGEPAHATSAAGTPSKMAPGAGALESWADVKTDDLASARDQLRAAGFPPRIIRAILAAQIRESFAARRKAIEVAQGEVPFWKNLSRDPKTAAALRDLDREQEKMLRDLLGRDARDDDPIYEAYTGRQFGDLPPEKVDQLRQIMDDYNSKRADIYNAARSGLLPDEQKKLAALDKEMRAEFTDVLSPQELADYDLRASNTANNLRYNLAAFDATEQEYRAIYQLQSAFDEKYGRMYGPLAPDEMKARSDAMKQLQDDIKTALGPDRYADYQRGTDFSYRQTSLLVARLELPPETATQVWAVQKETQQKRNELSGNRDLTSEQRTQQLTALAQNASARVTTLLGGSRGFEAYKTNGGQWLNELVPRPPPPVPPPPK